jgi:ATP-dependent RNA helicase RhlE
VLPDQYKKEFVVSFSSFDFNHVLRAAIISCGYVEPTPIQQQTIEPALQGRDIIGLAQTGTGKTAAFVLPMLQRLLTGPRKKIRALIIAPTRELAEQIDGYIGKLAHGTGLRSVVLYGGVGKHGQINKLRQGVEVVVACPGRLLDLLQQKFLDLKSVEMLVLDEADHMFDKGFLPDIKRILKGLPEKRQNLIFSATMPPEIRNLVDCILHQPVIVQINHTKPLKTITHLLFPVAQERKTALLKNILSNRAEGGVLVFTRTKHKAKNLAGQLQKAGFNAISIQGNLSQNKRQEALDGFKKGRFNILVATDIAARGIDVSGISHVINYDVPDTAETYTHRTGRTGRASRTGEAFTFASVGDGKMISLIEKMLGGKMARQTVSGFEEEIAMEEGAAVRRNTSRPPTSGRKKQLSRPAAKKRRSRASGFDFGLRTV